MNEPRTRSANTAAKAKTEDAYYTLAQASKASGYSQTRIREFLNSRVNPCPHKRGKGNRYLIPVVAFEEYLRNRGFACEEYADPSDEKSEDHKGLLELDKTFLTLSEISDVTGMPYKKLLAWTRDTENALPHIKRGNRAYVNKFKFMEYVEGMERK